MSAFIVSDDCMQNVISGLKFLVSVQPDKWNKKLGINDSFSEWNKLGNELFALNFHAVKYRYDHKDIDAPLAFKATQIKQSLVQSFKSMQCFLYQCNEGDFHTTPLYRMIEDAERDLGIHIVIKLPEYDKAKWS